MREGENPGRCGEWKHRAGPSGTPFPPTEEDLKKAGSAPLSHMRGASQRLPASFAGEPAAEAPADFRIPLALPLNSRRPE